MRMRVSQKKSRVILTPGAKLLPDCKLIRKLGEGGFAEVWEGEDTNTGERFALKILMMKPNGTSMVTTNEVRQLVTMRELDHPHLLKMYSVSTALGALVISMELAEGSLWDLYHIYRHDYGTHIPPGELMVWLGQAAMAIDFLSNQKITRPGSFAKETLQHCDIKPSNLLMLDNQIKVADFGLAGVAVGNQSGSFRGTYHYAAPEMFEGRPCSRSDQYSLAITYVYLRTGYYPVMIGKDYAYPSTSPDLSMLPEAEKTVVARALQRRWVDRYATCMEFMSELDRVIPQNEPAFRG